MAGLLGRTLGESRRVRSRTSTRTFFRSQWDRRRRETTVNVLIGPAPYKLIRYKLIRSLLSPELPGDKTFEELAQTLSSHYSPPPSEVIQRFCFNSRCRQAGESVAAYVADLRRLAILEQHSTLNKTIRDRLVSGVKWGEQ